MLIFIIEDCRDLVLSGVRFRLDISVYWQCLIWLVDLRFSFSVAVARVVVVAISIVNVIGVIGYWRYWRYWRYSLFLSNWGLVISVDFCLRNEQQRPWHVS